MTTNNKPEKDRLEDILQRVYVRTFLGVARHKGPSTIISNDLPEAKKELLALFHDLVPKEYSGEFNMSIGSMDFREGFKNAIKLTHQVIDRLGEIEEVKNET